MHLLIFVLTGKHTSDHSADGAFTDATFAGQHKNLHERYSR